MRAKTRITTGLDASNNTSRTYKEGLPYASQDNRISSQIVLHEVDVEERHSNNGADIRESAEYEPELEKP